MSINPYLNSLLLTQQDPVPGSVQNNAGGHVFSLDDRQRLERFLVLGTEGGTYYVQEKKITKENAEVVLRCYNESPISTIETIVDFSNGRAPKNTTCLFALALCASSPTRFDTATETFLPAEFEVALTKIARTGGDLQRFVKLATAMRGWGRRLRRMVAYWYTSKDPQQLAYQAIKYQQREGVSHRDLLRLSHANPSTSLKEDTNDVLHWVAKGWPGIGQYEPEKVHLRTIWAFEKARCATSADDIVKLVLAYNLPREAIPSQFLDTREVWEALSLAMPATALLRNLATLTRHELLGRGSYASKRLEHLLSDAGNIAKARIHPLQILTALKIYAQGHGLKSSQTWTPKKHIVDLLDAGFSTAFQAIQPMGKRVIIGLDVSGSMGSGTVAGSPLTPREASCALAMSYARSEPDTLIWAFSNKMSELRIDPEASIKDMVDQTAGLPFDGTDCAQPLLEAMRRKQHADLFITITDNETWAGRIRPEHALRNYRKEYNPNAKHVVIGMTSTGFTIADPNDMGSLDVVGFDAAVPDLIRSFVFGFSKETTHVADVDSE